MLTETPSRQLSSEERAAIDAAIAAGRVTICPSLPACGVSQAEIYFGFVGGPALSERQLRQRAAYSKLGGAAFKRKFDRRKVPA